MAPSGGVCSVSLSACCCCCCCSAGARTVRVRDERERKTRSESNEGFDVVSQGRREHRTARGHSKNPQMARACRRPRQLLPGSPAVPPHHRRRMGSGRWGQMGADGGDGCIVSARFETLDDIDCSRPRSCRCQHLWLKAVTDQQCPVLSRNRHKAPPMLGGPSDGTLSLSGWTDPFSPIRKEDEKALTGDDSLDRFVGWHRGELKGKEAARTMPVPRGGPGYPSACLRSSNLVASQRGPHHLSSRGRIEIGIWGCGEGLRSTQARETQMRPASGEASALL